MPEPANQNTPAPEPTAKTPERFEVGGKVVTAAEAAELLRSAEEARQKVSELDAELQRYRDFRESTNRFINTNDWDSFTKVARELGWGDARIEAFAKARDQRLAAARKPTKPVAREDDDEDDDEDTGTDFSRGHNSPPARKLGWNDLDPSFQQVIMRLANVAGTSLDRGLNADTKAAFDSDPVLGTLEASGVPAKRIAKLRSIALGEAQRLAQSRSGEYDHTVLAEAVAKARAEAAEWGVLPSTGSNSPPSGLPSLGTAPVAGLEQYRPTGKRVGKISLNDPNFGTALGDMIAETMATGKVPDIG